MKPVKPAHSPLTEEQLLISRLFGMMDDRRQQEVIVRLTRIAATHPRRARPALHLVAGDAK